MSKLVWPTVFILILSICGLLFFQWKPISTFSGGEKVEQNVVVRHMQDHFQIEQSIKHIPEGSYEMRKPTNLDSFSCTSSRHQSCIWLNQENTKIAIGEEETISFTYRLPSFKSPSHFVLDNWLFEVQNISRHSTRIQLTDEKWRQGEWVAAADSVGKRKMNAIDYYVFETNQKSPALYWNANEMHELYKDQYVTVYSESNVSADFSKLSNLNGKGKLVAIVTKKAKKLQDFDDLILVPEEEAILPAMVAKTISMEKNQEWLLDVIISAFLERPYGSKKAQSMYLELERELQKEGVERWLSKVLSDKTAISARRLDAHIWEETGRKTNFFALNEEETKAFIPFFAVDARPILIHEVQADNVSILYHNEQPYISFFPLAEQLGFTVQPGPDQAVMKRGDDTFEFYYGKKIFYKNGRPFGLSSNPFLLMGSETYIHTEVVSLVFGIRLFEADNKIKLQ
ncbi:stalk domain-containing protein [Siminovitchia sp. FSL H7-0308]|uniref:stalk domain-containing protein n=1 Tax=Siminovitchia sp. FSL H7-0308 TaxID=2921432 RepID=UPI0030EF9600